MAILLKKTMCINKYSRETIKILNFSSSQIPVLFP